MALRNMVWLRHVETGRRVPVELPTVFGRSDSYYRYTRDDVRPDRLRTDIVEGLAALNYIKLCSDDQVSRTHGLLDPALPGVCDLNSTNGVQLNGQDIPTRPGEQGPLVAVTDGDKVQVGRQVFEVLRSQVPEEEVRAALQGRRRGFVGAGPASIEGARRLEAFLRDERGFTMSRAVCWPAVIANLYRLQAEADPEGLAAVVLCAEVRGYELAIEGEGMAFAKLLPLHAAVPGRKLLLLVCEGDPSAVEHYFASEAFEDSALVTAPAGTLAPGGGEEDPARVQHTFGTSGLRDAVAEALRSPQGALEALIAADTNVLSVSWLEGLDPRQAAVRVVFGQREHRDDMALSHSLRLGSSTFRF